MNDIVSDKLPRHVAVIMDGNGRWAKKRFLPRINGHRKGINVARDVVTDCCNIGIKYLTLYTFSMDNWKRPASEVKMLMVLLENHFKKEAKMLMENNIRFKAIGKVGDLPKAVSSRIHRLEDETKENDGMTLHLALSYSAREEIVKAAKELAERAKSGEISVEEITEEAFSDCLYTAGTPDPDLLIRTSGEMRISNFLLWQLAYSEIYITDVLWPDFTIEHLYSALRDFQTRERRFGQTGSQLAGVVG